MAPSSTQQILLSPAELSYLHTSLTLTPPIRPDGRLSTQFRPLIAETGILPGTNGSARICFADGTEAIVGIKAEVEKSRTSYGNGSTENDETEESRGESSDETEKEGLNEWVEMSVEIPGFRDDDSMPIFLAALLSEALLADGEFTKKLWINRRFHWKVYLDVRLKDYSIEDLLTLLDLTSLTTSLISITITLTHYPPCTSVNQVTEIEIRRRRRSVV
jgi:exosome complex component RRP42